MNTALLKERESNLGEPGREQELDPRQWMVFTGSSFYFTCTTMQIDQLIVHTWSSGLSGQLVGQLLL